MSVANMQTCISADARAQPRDRELLDGASSTCTDPLTGNLIVLSTSSDPASWLLQAPNAHIGKAPDHQPGAIGNVSVLNHKVPQALYPLLHDLLMDTVDFEVPFPPLQSHASHGTIHSCCPALSTSQASQGGFALTISTDFSPHLISSSNELAFTLPNTPRQTTSSSQESPTYGEEFHLDQGGDYLTSYVLELYKPFSYCKDLLSHTYKMFSFNDVDTDDESVDIDNKSIKRGDIDDGNRSKDVLPVSYGGDGWEDWAAVSYEP